MRSAHGIVLAIGIGIAGNAAAQSGDSVHWRCWYEDEPAPRLACRLAEVPGPEAALQQDPRWEALPPFVRELRKSPGSFVDRIVVVPMHGPMTDVPHTVKLAQGVMCGSRTGCRVDFGTPQ